MVRKTLLTALAFLAFILAWYAPERPTPKEVCVIVDDSTWSGSRPTVVPRFWFTQLNV